MTTLAKTKAQALVQPAKPLAVTPNVRLFNNPAAGATLSLSTESTNIVQVVNPASTLSINVDSQNFSAFGANHFVLHVDTTAATEISLNFVRGATILTTKVIEIDADQIAVLTFAAITKANDAVSLLAIGHHVVGKSEATDGNSAGSGLLLIPNGATESVDGEYQRFEPIDPIAGSWIAQLAMEDWQDALVVQFKVPALTTSHQVLMISFISGDITNLGNKLSCQITNGSISFGVFAGISTTYSAAQPAADTVITLNITQQSATLAYGEVSETIDISTDNLAVPFNCAVSSSGFEGDAVLPLSIKVAEG